MALAAAESTLVKHLGAHGEATHFPASQPFFVHCYAACNSNLSPCTLDIKRSSSAWATEKEQEDDTFCQGVIRLKCAVKI
jgi:hypothetical protein